MTVCNLKSDPYYKLSQCRFSPYPSSCSARLIIVVSTFRHHAPVSFVHSIHDPTGVAVKRMIEASQRMSKIDRQGEKEKSPVNRHFELEIETLSASPRDAEISRVRSARLIVLIVIERELKE
jgi:hypothetical protein